MMTARASAVVAPRSLTTKRLTLAYRAVKPWSSTRSCQIAIALRPRPSASSIRSRYGSHALAVGDRAATSSAAARNSGGRSVDTSPVVAGFAPGDPVDTGREIAGFGPFESVDTSPVVAGF